MFRSLLVALTPGGRNDASARYAVALAQRRNLRLRGLTIIDRDQVVPTEAVPLGGTAYKTQRNEELLERIRLTAKVTLAELCEQANQAGVHCETMVREGDLPVELAIAAESSDLLIVGHGAEQPAASAGTHTHVLHSILKHCARPVVVTPRTAFTGNAVLVAYDGSLHAVRALHSFATSELYRTHPVHVLILHENPDAGGEIAQRAVDYLHSHDMIAELHVDRPQGEAGQQILEWTQRTESGLLVMGALGHSRLREFILGSTTHTILDAGTIPTFLEH